MSSKVSFTIRRPPSSSAPTPHSAPSASHPGPRQTSFIPHLIDSSDEEVDDSAAEYVIGFDQSGMQRLHEKPKPSGPLVIAPLANRDWRAIARARKQQRFIPDGTAAPIGKDGSQGGLGTRDAINSGPQEAGLVKRQKVIVAESEEETVQATSEEAIANVQTSEESEDERARRALIASAGGDNGGTDAITIEAIPLGVNEFTHPSINETDAYRQDVITRPDSVHSRSCPDSSTALTPSHSQATLADYERVPVSQFGAALLRGMGWKEGTAASRTRQGLVEPWLPTSRPALLGIGAKERPAEDIPVSGKGGYASKRPEKRYIPVVKMQREGSARPPPPSRSRSRSPSRSGKTSRVPSKSSSPYPSDKLVHQHSRDKRYDDYDYEKTGRDRDRDRDSARDVNHLRGRRSDRDNRESRDNTRRYDRDHEEWGRQRSEK